MNLPSLAVGSAGLATVVVGLVRTVWTFPIFRSADRDAVMGTSNERRRGDLPRLLNPATPATGPTLGARATGFTSAED
jgi:hypothetical protein